MDAIAGFINANMVWIGFIWGLLVKYLPVLKGIPNKLIPYMNAVIALLTGLLAPQAANASIGSFIHGHTFLGHLVNAGWSAIQSALIYEVFGRHMITAPKA